MNSTAYQNRKPINFDKKLQHSIELLQKSEKLALRYSNKGFYLAFSGGKDSQSLYHVAVLSGVKFDAHYSLTTLDPPELVMFIRNKYPNVAIDRPKLTFAQLCIKSKALPTRLMRFCCAVLKETKGAGTVTLTGVRREESPNPGKTNCLTTVAKDNLIMQRPRGKNKGAINTEKSPTLSANSWQQNNLLVSKPKDGIRQINPSRESGGTQPYQQNRVYAADGKSPALMNGHGGQTINALVGGAASQTINADGVRPTANYTRVV